ncbi:glutathione S-transferase family protein [Formicincola oecophyllae]|nr:glutathione S-transferase family protein [Formicincola oecophyllae]
MANQPGSSKEYHLITAPGTAGLAPHILLEMNYEMNGAAYQLTLINLREGDQKKPDFLKLNPLGRVPVLVLPNGDPMVESAAITMTLARSCPSMNLIPPTSNETQYAYWDQWLVFLTNSVQADLMIAKRPERLIPGTEPEQLAAQKAASAGATARVENYFNVIGEHLKDHGPYMLGDAISAPDIYLAMVCRWARELPKPPRTHQAIANLLDKIDALPAVKAVLKQEGLEGPLA